MLKTVLWCAAMGTDTLISMLFAFRTRWSSFFVSCGERLRTTAPAALGVVEAAMFSFLL
jgi:hypothetical protein